MPAAVTASGARAPTRELILDAVERLIAAKGVNGFTLRDVAEPLNVRVPAIYKHFRSRDDVLIEVSRRFITLLAAQFQPAPGADPVRALRRTLDNFVEFQLNHSAYVRLALVDFATPSGGMEFVKLAAGGSFRDNFSAGPLAAMHLRLRRLLRAGARSGQIRRVDATDFYRVVTAALLIRLVFPDDAQLLHRPPPAQARAIKRWLWGIASRYLALPQSARARAHGRQR